MKQMNTARSRKYFVKRVGSFTPLKMNKQLSEKYKGLEKFLEQSNAYVNGMHVIKKANFAKHLLFENNKKATLRLKEKELMSAAAQSSSADDMQTSSSRTPKQTLLRPMLQKVNVAQRQQLGRKFQLAHFTSSNAKSFKTYADFAAFEKKYHDVDLGASYLMDKAGAEIMKYISISQQMTNITEPLNNDVLNYYSVLFDGASSAKCVDEKELFIIKTCVEGQPTFNVMSLEEPEECNVQGIKEAMEHSLSKMNFNFERKDKEIGMCSDGASVNPAVYKPLVEEFGDHYLLMLCPSHKFELAINDAFGSSLLNNATEKEVYYFFKKSPLR
jgi:predicted DNA binding CopG/RHH family protein